MQFNENQQLIADALNGCRVTLLNGRYRAIGTTTTILNYLAWEAEFVNIVPTKMLYLDSRQAPVHVLAGLGYISDRYKDHYRVGRTTTLDTAMFSNMESKFRGYSQPYDVVIAEDIKAREFIKLFDLIQHTTRPEREQYVYIQQEDYMAPRAFNPEQVTKAFYREPPRIIISSYEYEPIEEFLISWYNGLNKDEDDQSLALVNEFDGNLHFMNNPNYRPY